MKDELRFYICLILGYSLMMAGFWVPPVGIITSSVLWGSGLFLSIGAIAIGIDLKGIIRELRYLKEAELKENKENG